MKRLPAVLVTVFSVAAFGLYYIGVYDISFIERPESWKGNLDAFIAVLDKSYKVSPQPEEPEPEEEPAPTTEQLLAEILEELKKNSEAHSSEAH